MEQDDAQALAMGADVQKVVQRANPVDGDLLAWLLFAASALFALPFLAGQRVRQDQPEVRVIALRHPAAGKTTAAGHPRGLWIFAEQRLGKGARQGGLADAAWPREQQGVRQPIAALIELLPGFFV